MKALVDTCIIIDVLQNREPFSDDAKQIFFAVANKEITGYISAKSVLDVYYLTHRLTHSDEITRKILKTLLGLFDILDTTQLDIRQALSSKITDYEDAVMCETAKRCDVDCIVTRNQKDYECSEMVVYSPKEFLDKITKIQAGE